MAPDSDTVESDSASASAAETPELQPGEDAEAWQRRQELLRAKGQQPSRLTVVERQVRALEAIVAQLQARLDRLDPPVDTRARVPIYSENLWGQSVIVGYRLAEDGG